MGELLCIKLDKLRDLKRRCGTAQTQSDEVEIIKRSPLFKNCPQHILVTVLGELSENREAACGDDPLTKWDGLVLIKEGQLQLWADPSPSTSSRGKTKTSAASPKNSKRKWSPR